MNFSKIMTMETGAWSWPLTCI